MLLHTFGHPLEWIQNPSDFWGTSLYKNNCEEHLNNFLSFKHFYKVGSIYFQLFSNLFY